MGGKVNPIAGAAPELETLSPRQAGAKRVKVRYGPYMIPNRNSGFVGKASEGEGGMLWNVPDMNVKKPCTDCMITMMQAGLESDKGASVNTNSGLWLHHMVAINIGKGRSDATCANTMSLPHVDVGTSPAMSERFFSSGNERTFFEFASTGKKAGYYVAPSDKFSFIVDLMNTNKADKRVYMTIDYEYVDGTPEGYSAIKPVWFDVIGGQCAFSDVPATNDKSFVLNSSPWRPNFSGDVLLIGGHLHDGGTHLEVIQNGKVVCDTVAKYGGSPEYVSKDMGDGMATQHLSSMSKCNAGTVNPGDNWIIKSYYDYTVHPGMKKENGKPANVMGISILWVAVPLKK